MCQLDNLYKNPDMIVTILSIAFAFTIAYSIDVNNNPMLPCSTAVFFAMTGGIRFADACNKKRNESVEKSK